LAVAGAIAGICLLAGLLSLERWYSETLREAADAEMQQAMVISANLLFADTTLTSSARLAAATGDDKWSERYQEYLPKIDKAIADAKSLATPIQWAAYDTSARIANDKLVAFEEKAFEFVAAGDLVNAQKLLNSTQYETQKSILVASNEAFTKDLIASLRARLICRRLI
jgi:hypothetical protein